MLGIGGQFTAHFYQRHLFPFPCQVNSGFTASQTTAQDNDCIFHAVFLLVVIIDQNHMITLQPGDRRLYWQRPHCQDQSIRLQFFHQSRCHFCVQTDLSTGIPGQFGQRVAQLVHFVFEWDGLFFL